MGEVGRIGIPDRRLPALGKRFFIDLEKAPSAHLYQPLGVAGRIFLSIETQAFALAA